MEDKKVLREEAQMNVARKRMLRVSLFNINMILILIYNFNVHS